MHNAVLVSTVLCLASCGVGKQCTEIGCEAQITVRFEGTLPDGSYAVEMAAVGEPPSTCMVIMSGGQAEPASDCELWVAVVDGALEATLNQAPEEVFVALIEVGADSLVDQVLSPTYEPVQPNGPDCEPTCDQAVEAVSL